MKHFYFRRQSGDRIETIGTSFSGKVSVLGMAGDYELWRVAPGKVYSGQGRPWRRTLARLMIIRVIGQEAYVQRECQPGNDWRRKRQDFLDEMSDMGGGREGLLRFQSEG